jgi:hypothetical protein
MGTGGILKVDPKIDWAAGTNPALGSAIGPASGQGDLSAWYQAHCASTCNTCPVLSHPFVSDEFFETKARVCDVAVAGEYLYAAADDRGLVEIDLSQGWPWPPTAMSAYVERDPYTRPPVTTPTCNITYARFVDAKLDAANGILVAVGSSAWPSRLNEAAPYYNHGRMGWDLMPGGTASEIAKVNPGWSTLLRFSGAGGGLSREQNDSRDGGGSWGGIAVIPNGVDSRVYTQRMGHGLPGLNKVNFGAGTVEASYAGRGLNPFGGTFGAVQRNQLILTNEGPMGAENVGWLEIYPGGATIPQRVRPIGALGTSWGPLGTVPFDAQFVETGTVTNEWIGASYVHGWKFRRLAQGLASPIRWWQLPAPAEGVCPPPNPNDPDPTGKPCSSLSGCRLTGQLYLSSTSDSRTGSHLWAMTRCQIREGLVLLDRQRLLDWIALPVPPVPACSTANCGPDSLATCYESGLCWLFRAPSDPTIAPYLHLTDFAGFPQVLTTHPEIVPGWCGALSGFVDCQDRNTTYRDVRTWKSKFVNVPGSPTKTYLVAAAGTRFDVGTGDTDAGKAQIAVFDVTDVTSDPNQSTMWVGSLREPRVGVGYVGSHPSFGPPLSYGQAISVDSATITGDDGANYTIAFVADWGGRVLAFDLTNVIPHPNDPSIPVVQLVGWWEVPVSTYDGYYDNISDVAVDNRVVSNSAIVYASAMRLGVVRLRASVHVNGGSLKVNFDDVRAILTPGLAHGLLWRPDANGDGHTDDPQLVVADKNDGVRVLGFL